VGNERLGPYAVSFEDVEVRQRIASTLMRLFERWRLDPNTQLRLLGLSPGSHSSLSAFADGTEALPQRHDTRDRVAHLLTIHKALRLLYPENPELRYDWVNRRNRAFDNLRPIEVMDEQGLAGIARVARFLEHECGRPV
jgi:hypothetical protein